MSHSLTGIGSRLHKLTPIQLFVFLMMFSLCYKGSSKKRMREVSYIYISNSIKELYGIEITARQVRRSVDKLVKLEFIERKTASFVKQYGTQMLPTKRSFYRLHLL